MAEAARRPLKFDNCLQIRDEVLRLQKNGYTPHGKWNLAQTCLHLNDWMTFPMDGFPKAPIPISWIFAIVSATMGRGMLLKMLRSGEMKSGKPTMPETVYKASVDEENAAVERFLATIDRWDNFRGSPVRSPLFGAMTSDEARQLQLIHCALHLSFLEPKS